jgi:hypothetical protein
LVGLTDASTFARVAFTGVLFAGTADTDFAAWALLVCAWICDTSAIDTLLACGAEDACTGAYAFATFAVFVALAGHPFTGVACTFTIVANFVWAALFVGCIALW